MRQGQAIDVVLDVQMPQESGMVLLASWRQQQPPIVFVTAYQHYAVQAFEFHAIDYLLKPFDDRLAAALKRVEDLIDLRRKEHPTLMPCETMWSIQTSPLKQETVST
jgi:two-component system LytT family response regulator